jgi:hypothetical protein
VAQAFVEPLPGARRDLRQAVERGRQRADREVDLADRRVELGGVQARLRIVGLRGEPRVDAGAQVLGAPVRVDPRRGDDEQRAVARHEVARRPGRLLARLQLPRLLDRARRRVHRQDRPLGRRVDAVLGQYPASGRLGRRALRRREPARLGAAPHR